MKKRGKCSLHGLAAGFALVAAAAGGANVSSLETGGFLDNGEIPSLRVVSDEGIEIPFSGEWTGGRCELFVDGVSVGVSDSGLSLHAVGVGLEAFKTYRLTLVSDRGTVTRFVTFVPSFGFCSAMHALESDVAAIDARPAGTVRRLKVGKTMPLAWSSLWSETADMVKVEVRKGHAADGESLGTLVDAGAPAEGNFMLSPGIAGLAPGPYTLTHFDGSENLFAYIKVTGTGLLMVVR